MHLKVHYVFWRTTWPVSRNSPSCCPTLTLNYSYASEMPFLKWLTRIFFAKGNACVSKNSFHAIGLLCKTQIFRPAFKVLLANGLLALKTEIFLQLLIFSFTEQYWLFGHLSRLTSHSSTAQERSEAIWGKFHRGRLQHDVKRLRLDTVFVGFTGQDNPPVCHPWKVLPLLHTLSPHNVIPF